MFVQLTKIHVSGHRRAVNVRADQVDLIENAAYEGEGVRLTLRSGVDLRVEQGPAMVRDRIQAALLAASMEAR